MHMAVKIPSAKPSPRIVNGILYWYEGDTFPLYLDFELSDADGEPITVTSAAEIEITFYDHRETDVKTFSFTGVQNNTVTLVFDENVTALFPSGEYTYDIVYRNGYDRTIVHDNEVIVE